MTIYPKTAAVLLLLGVALVTEATPVAAQSKADSLKRSAVSPIDFYATNTGIFGHNPVTRSYGMSYPRGSAQHYLFGSGLWFGAKKRSIGFRPLVFTTYNPITGRSMATPGEARNRNAARPDIYHSVEYNRHDGTYSGSTSDTAPNWPLWNVAQTGLSSIFMPGEFLPYDTQRVIGSRDPAYAFNADEQMVTRYHDGDLSRYEIDSAQARALGYPLGLQVQQSVYTWNNDWLRQVVVVQYEVVNISADTLVDCVAAHLSDPDIGRLDNDRSGFFASIPALRAGYVYTEPEEVADYAMMVLSVIEGPVTEGASNFINNSRRRDYAAVGRLGAFPRLVAGSPNEPVTPADRYAAMIAGGFSIDSASTPDIGSDRRALIATTKFSMRPGDTAHFAVAYMLIESTPQKLSDSLQRFVNGLQNRYYDTPPVVSMRQDRDRTSRALSIAPNPAGATTSLHYTIDEPSPVRIRLVNPLAQTVFDDQQPLQSSGDHYRRLDISTLSPGVYMIVVETNSRRIVERLVVR